MSTDVNKLITTYVKLRDAKSDNRSKYLEKDKSLAEKMDIIANEIMQVCDDNGVTQMKSPAGTAFKQVKTRYWAPDWDAFSQFAIQHDAPQLFEKRIAQGAYKEFIAEHPDVVPPVDADSKYVITVRRGTKK